MEQLNMNIFKGFVVLIVVLHQICAKEVYQMDIDERGTKFNETIEIDDKLKTVIYKVPSHNGIEKSDYLVDYKHGYFVTRVAEREECFIKSFPTSDEPSLHETKQNLKLLQYYQTKTQDITVETVKKVMRIIREVPRDKQSAEIAQFCGNYTAYLAKEEDMPKKYKKSIVKRTNVRFYTYSLAKTASVEGMKAILPNGYLSCKKPKEYVQALVNCSNKRKRPRVGCGIFPVTCRYQLFCDLAEESDPKVPVEIHGKEHIPVIFIKVKCVEEHKLTEAFCCDVLPC